MENTKRSLKGCLWVLTMKFDDLMQLLSAEHSIDGEAEKKVQMVKRRFSKILLINKGYQSNNHY